MVMYEWRPYVPVAQRKRAAMKKMEQLRRKGQDIQPIEIEGRKIAKTFWGGAWCDHMESLGDYDNRLPRGRTYVRNGSVCHLAISKGQVDAIVTGSEIYKIKVEIQLLSAPKWTRVQQRCAGHIGSLLELLQGKLSAQVMKVVTDQTDGLFPLQKEIKFKCSCPDWASMCKHVAAVLYGVGARLDTHPELIFLLRGVNHNDLVDAQAGETVTLTSRGKGSRRTVATGDLADVFGIELTEEAPAKAAPAVPVLPRKKPMKKKPTDRSSTVNKGTKRKPARKKVPKRKPRAQRIV